VPLFFGVFIFAFLFSNDFTQLIRARRLGVGDEEGADRTEQEEYLDERWPLWFRSFYLYPALFLFFVCFIVKTTKSTELTHKAIKRKVSFPSLVLFIDVSIVSIFSFIDERPKRYIVWDKKNQPRVLINNNMTKNKNDK